MKSIDHEIVPCDIIVIGGGGAGLTAAIAAREMHSKVTLVSKSRVGYGNNTFISKGAISAVNIQSEPSDSPKLYVHDAFVGGRFINDRKLLEKVCQEACARIDFLEKIGVKFARNPNGLSYNQAPGHSAVRTVRTENKAGRDLTLPLRKYAQKIGIRFIENVFITRIVISKDRFAAVIGVTTGGKLLGFSAKSCVLASGGFAQAYLRNSNAAGITGDGLVQAFELGVPLKDVEFVQFYPTASGPSGNRLLLYDYLVLRAGGVLKNSIGDDIIVKHGLSDTLLLTRDRLTRAIMHEIIEGHDIQSGIIMDLSNVPENSLLSFLHLLPANRRSSQRKFIVSPTAHYCMGGIMTDENGATQIPGLYAAGEVCAGVHGANRIAGNSLAEVFAIGGVAGENAAAHAKTIGPVDLPEKEILAEKIRIESLRSKGNLHYREYRRKVQKILWQSAGIIRDRKGLEKGLAQTREIMSIVPRLRIDKTRELFKTLELKNMVVLAEIICRAALLRTESRGAHYRSDYPEEDNENWLKNIVIQKIDSEIQLRPVQKKRLSF